MIAWSRKYRPAKIEELDQKRVRDYFSKVLKSGKVSQAYLFTGPKGTGKTSTSRILAAMLNCEKNREKVLSGETNLEEPCGVCESCKAIRTGNGGGVVEIDAASNRGIDDIRLLRERVGLIQGGSVRSVYIIDEVHMLTKEAFNALLKTLEEPPGHVVFCLCTTEEHKLLPTIVSRCTRIGFANADNEEVLRSLGRVVEGEKLSVTQEALEKIADISGGSFRDAVKHLERLASETEKITVELVEETLGIVGDEAVKGLVDWLRKGEINQSLELSEQLLASGADAEQICLQVIEVARNMLLVEIANNEIDSLSMEMIDVFSKSLARFGDVPINSLPLEMAIVEYGLKSGKLQRVNSGGGSSGAGERKKEEKVKRKSVEKKVKTKVIKAEESGASMEQEKVNNIKRNEVEEIDIDSEVKVVEENETKEVVVSESQIKKNWGVVLSKVAKQNHGLMTLLNRAKVSGCHGEFVEMKVGYTFHKEQLEQDRYLRILEQVFDEVFGSRLRLAVEVSTEKIASTDMPHNNVSGAIPEEDQALIGAVEEVFGM